MTVRKHISTRERARLFKLHGGRCHLCKGLIDGTREAWDVSHDTPLAMNGADDDANRLLAHRKCHRAHTAQVDIPTIAEAKRREAKHNGSFAKQNRLQGAPFRPGQPARRASSKLIKDIPPRRSLFTREQIQ